MFNITPMSVPLLALTSILQMVSAAPSQLLSLRATPPNVEELTCFPPNTDSNLAPLPSKNCHFALQKFTAMHKAAPNHEVIFTTNVSKAEDPAFSTQYVATPQEIEPSGEPSEPACGLAYAVYEGAATPGEEPDVTVELSALRIATKYVIGNCTGSHGAGNGGSIVLTTPGARQIDITVERGV